MRFVRAELQALEYGLQPSQQLPEAPRILKDQLPLAVREYGSSHPKTESHHPTLDEFLGVSSLAQTLPERSTQGHRYQKEALSVILGALGAAVIRLEGML